MYSEYRVESLSRSIPFIKYFFIFLGIFVVKNKIEFNNIKLNFYLIILGFSILIVLLSSTAELFRLDLPIYTKSTVNYRLNGPFGDEAIVGSYLFSFLPSIIFMFETNNFKRTLKIIIISLIYFIIIASGERMVIIMSTILLFFYLVPKYSKTLFICLSMSILVLALTISFKSIIFKNEYHDSYLFRIEQTLREFSDPFNTSYFIHYKTALEIFKNHKIFGAGVKSYRYECSKDKYDNVHPDSDQRCRTHPHNLHLEIISETGIIGYLLFLTFFIYFFTNNKINSIKNKNYILIIACIIAFFPLRVSGSFFSSIYGGLFWYQFLVLSFFYKKIK